MHTATMSIRRISSTAAIVDVDGDLTQASEDALLTAFGEASGAGARAVLLNFSHLVYMNSVAIGQLVTLLMRARRQGRRLIAYGLDQHHHELFSLARLDGAIEVYDSESDALAAALRFPEIWAPDAAQRARPRAGHALGRLFPRRMS